MGAATPHRAARRCHNYRVPAVADLLDALATTPNLRGAACTGHRDLFDAAVAAKGRPGELHTQAIAVCAHCPALQRCEAWITRLPPRQRPHGVIAGRYWSQRARAA
jgi:WhiB family redox-sensing transcriptional regulator